MHVLVALHNVYYAYGVKVEKGTLHLHFKVGRYGNFNWFKHCFPLCPYQSEKFYAKYLDTNISKEITNVVISQAKSSGYMLYIYAKHYKIN